MIHRFEPGARYCTAVSYAGLVWISGVVGWNNQKGPLRRRSRRFLGGWTMPSRLLARTVRDCCGFRSGWRTSAISTT